MGDFYTRCRPRLEIQIKVAMEDGLITPIPWRDRLNYLLQLLRLLTNQIFSGVMAFG
jgi:hypothetical protein